MATEVPTAAPVAAPSTNTLTLVLSAGVALVIAIGLIVLIALGKLTWADGGPLVAVIVGVHGGASLASFVPK